MNNFVNYIISLNKKDIKRVTTIELKTFSYLIT